MIVQKILDVQYLSVYDILFSLIFVYCLRKDQEKKMFFFTQIVYNTSVMQKILQNKSIARAVISLHSERVNFPARYHI